MKATSLGSLSLLLTLAFGANLAMAQPLPSINGTINFDGEATTNTGSLATGTAFSSITNTYVDQNTMTGSYATVAGLTAVVFSPFSFTSSSVTPLWTFTVGTGASAVTYSFAATSIVINQQSSTFLNLSGTGIASITGDANTAGTWSITDTGNGPNFTFGSGAAATPDSGTTALLMSLGLAAVGLGVFSQRGKSSRRASA